MNCQMQAGKTDRGNKAKLWEAKRGEKNKNIKYETNKVAEI